jgi:hypothetical protein
MASNATVPTVIRLMFSINVAQMYRNENGSIPFGETFQVVAPYSFTTLKFPDNLFYRERKSYLCRPNIPP